MEVPGIEPATSWIVVRHADQSANEAIIFKYFHKNKLSFLLKNACAFPNLPKHYDKNITLLGNSSVYLFLSTNHGKRIRWSKNFWTSSSRIHRNIIWFIIKTVCRENILYALPSNKYECGTEIKFLTGADISLFASNCVNCTQEKKKSKFKCLYPRKTGLCIL